MKEFSIEEKAKAYDEALERAEKALEVLGTDKCEGARQIFSLFPELRESEDERVRKALLEMVHDTTGDELWVDYNIHKEDALAWLEKQGETYTKKDVDNAYLEGMAFAKDELEKQGKQKPQRMISAEAKEAMYDKPADTVELKCEESKTRIFDTPTPFEDKLYVFVAACEFLAIPSKIEFILEHSQEILDAAREQIGKEQSSAWSEEDELVVEDIEEAVINYWHGQSQEDLLDWLKSLKTKVQPKQEWSEKDEEELEIAIDTLKESGRYDSAKWVQSLKQRIGG